MLACPGMHNKVTDLSAKEFGNDIDFILSERVSGQGTTDLVGRRDSGYCEISSEVVASSWMRCIPGGVAPPQRSVRHVSRGRLFQAR